VWARVVLAVSLIVVAGAALGWLRGGRDIRPTPLAEAQRPAGVTLAKNYPGGQPPPSPPPPAASTRYEETGYDVSEGKRLYTWFNCKGCHANGGGGIGPALMDDRWIYGAEPRNIYETIVEGRPNGMPSFRNKIPDQQIWQIAAYVRSMSGLVPAYARSSRNDDLSAKRPESLVPRQPPQPGGNVPASAERPQ
jgi:cytochrome c oxidase cbb3-type subunit III